MIQYIEYPFMGFLYTTSYALAAPISLILCEYILVQFHYPQKHSHVYTLTYLITIYSGIPQAKNKK